MKSSKLGRNRFLLLSYMTLSSAGCWVGTEPRHVEHHEHEQRAPAEDGDNHHDNHHDEHHDEHHEHEHHD